MKIAVLSGKGGTGKTFVSANLATVMNKGTYVDCDVEEPNGHLFFKPIWQEIKDVNRQLPVIDMEQCTDCRKCSEFCKFNALANVGSKILVFEEVCHSCGGCAIICPANAISEKDKKVGEIRKGHSLDTIVYSGIMNVKEASGIPIIDSLLEAVKGMDDVVYDCPPGSACSVMESIKDADYCVLVAEPTIFGTHNLAMIHELVMLYQKPFGVVLNKTIEGNNPSKEYCELHNIKVLTEIAYDDNLAHLLSQGLLPAREDAKYHHLFTKLLSEIEVSDNIKEVFDETIISS